MMNQQTLHFDIAHHFDLIQKLQKIGKTQEAILTVENACNLFPEEYLFKLFKNLFFPIDDKVCVAALEKFYQGVVREHIMQN